jgi:hypothetical protein
VRFEEWIKRYEHARTQLYRQCGKSFDGISMGDSGSSKKRSDGISSLEHEFHGIMGGYLMVSSSRRELRFGVELMVHAHEIATSWRSIEGYPVISQRAR